MKVLVAIANYGFKNRAFLDALIQEYRSMPYRVDIVVLSNVPKELGPIEVKVGLPAKNPWSLPFGHKEIFAERLEDYDLFIYSEDDILITQKNIETFLQLTKILPEGHISGFLRYELDSSGNKWYPDFIGPFHWIPGSVRRVGQIAFAEFSNAHSACYILTRSQLRRAIASGGYLVGPHEGRYDLLCSAATDPYTQCDFKKVISLSHISGVLVHHLSNRYTGRFGIDQSDFDTQIAFMLSPDNGKKSRQELFATTKNGIDDVIWDKVYFDRSDCPVSGMVSGQARSILSIGCGYPALESSLAQDNRLVTAIPLDPIVGTLAASRGITVTEPDFEAAFHALGGASFDCILFSDVLQHLEDPADILARAVRLLAPGGEVLISIPNFRYLRYLRDEFPYPLLRKWTYLRNFLNGIDKSRLTIWLRMAGITEIDFKYVVESEKFKKLTNLSSILNILLANRLLAKGRKQYS